MNPALPVILNLLRLVILDYLRCPANLLIPENLVILSLVRLGHQPSPEILPYLESLRCPAIQWFPDYQWNPASPVALKQRSQ
jgi:hypothetical protein